MNANTVAQTVLSQIHKQKGFDHMAKKRIVMALGHDALGTNLPEQKKAVAATQRGSCVHVGIGQGGDAEVRAISAMIFRTVSVLPC